MGFVVLELIVGSGGQDISTLSRSTYLIHSLGTTRILIQLLEHKLTINFRQHPFTENWQNRKKGG